MKSNKVIYLDMDGVLADFIEGFINIHGRDDLMDKYKNGNWPQTWNFDNEFGPLDTWWDKIDEIGEIYWEYLNAYQWSNRLVMELEASEIPWYVCTTPRLTPNCLSGKLKWLQHHLGNVDVIFAKDKWRLAHSNSLLIDDNDINCKKFFKAGGQTCLFPQPWNAKREEAQYRMDVFLQALESFKEEKTLANY